MDPADAVNQPIFRTVLKEVPLSKICWIEDTDAVPVGNTGDLDLFDAGFFSAICKKVGSCMPLCFGRDEFHRNFVTVHLQVQASRPFAAHERPDFAHAGRPQRYVFTVFEKFWADREHLFICASKRSLDPCPKAGSPLFFLLFGISSPFVTEFAALELNRMFTALYRTSQWEKKVPLLDFDCNHSQARSGSDLMVVTRVTFCHDF